MELPSAVTALRPSVQDVLVKVVKPKFDAYFSFTSSGAAARSIPDPSGRFIYPEHTIIPDLIFLCYLFSDVYQVLGGPEKLANFVRSEPNMLSDFHRIVEGTCQSDQDGSFWHFPDGQVPIHEATGDKLKDLLRTLRNGFAHSHWCFANLSALDYWRELGWETAGADPRFNLQGRPKKNYMAYVADASAREWKPQSFWGMNNLRILVTPSHILRFHLHLFLNFTLNGSRANIFEH